MMFLFSFQGKQGEPGAPGNPGLRGLPVSEPPVNRSDDRSWRCKVLWLIQFCFSSDTGL